MNKYLVSYNKIEPLDGESCEDFLVSDEVFRLICKSKEIRVGLLKEFEKETLIIERLGIRLNTADGEDLYVKSLKDCNLNMNDELLKLYRGSSDE